MTTTHMLHTEHENHTCAGWLWCLYEGISLGEFSSKWNVERRIEFNWTL